ncbi:MAG: T9SS type A sorting domain-containing protein, partial [Sediminibacterium sp.]|nr:T9SS type A sorting domain-containing protein [Sediminibacterium sp.]
VLTTTNSQINIPLSKGLNKVSVVSDQECLGIYSEEIVVNDELKAYPNPTKGKLIIELGEQTEKLSVEVMVSDMNGMEVIQQQVTVENGNKINIDLSTLKSGVYLIKVGNKLVRVIKND